MRDPDSYGELDLALRLGTAATGVDIENHTEALDDGVTAESSTGQTRPNRTT